ncbi:MAG: DUF11 domain-containing protein [Sedimentisphaerales bacterium]|nr:DUF11 domain-containing protein [Sedimentisphaerales bacterium]
MKKKQTLVIFGLLLATTLIMVAGCSSYPTKFGILHGGHIDREHGKPMEGGYYSDFDPEAATLEVTPLEDTNPVQTQHVLIATVKDAQGNPLNGRRVEWMISEGSVGSIVEVDESGWYNTRGYKVNNKYAVSHTNYGDHVLTRGNNDPSDDVILKKGQTWVTITSPIEGDTHVIAYAPAIFNWEKHKVFAVKHWNDATWEWPPDATNPIGTTHDMQVKVMQYSDGTPLPGVIVNFKIVSGPDAMFEPSKKKAVSVKTDAMGLAKVKLAQASPVEGQNVIEMEIIREQCGECNPPMRLAVGKMTKTWVGPRIGIKKTAPAKAGVGEVFAYDITVNNPGKAVATNVMVVDVLPDGIAYVSSAPAASVAGQKLQWSLGSLAKQQSKAISVKVKATKTGRFENCADVTADNNLKARACAATVVTAPNLALTKTGPTEVLICEPITYTVTVTNNGDGPAVNVKVSDKLPDGLKTTDGQTSVMVNAGTLQPGQSKNATYKVMASKKGTYNNTAVATGDGGLKAEATHKVIVKEPVLVLTKTGPAERYVNRNATYEITITNKGDGDARNATMTDTIPSGMTFVSATDGGTFANGKVSWNLGTLAPNATKKVSLTLKADQIGNMTNRVTAEALCVDAQAETSTKITGIAAILLEVVDLEDPIEVGTNETYVITVTNQGSAQDTGIKVVCILPAELDYISSGGPTTATVAGKVVTFAPLANLDPKAKATYRLVVKGNAPGDVRFKVELNSDQMTSPVNETESTHVYE